MYNNMYFWWTAENDTMSFDTSPLLGPLSGVPKIFWAIPTTLREFREFCLDRLESSCMTRRYGHDSALPSKSIIRRALVQLARRCHLSEPCLVSRNRLYWL
jgi:hypothetical protein